MRFYAACLASYNNGVLHGVWVDASTDTEAMQDEINAMLRASRYPNVMVEHEGEQVPSAEEYAIHDYDDMDSSLGEYPGLAKIAEYVERCEAWEETGIPKEVWSKLEDHVTPDDYLGKYESVGDYAAEMYGEEVPEALQYYIDWDKMGRDWQLSGDINVVEHGYKEVYIFSNH